jgi:hypothetical protein
LVNREERLVDELVSVACSTLTVALEGSAAGSRFLSVGEDRTSGWGRGTDAQPELRATAASREKPKKERMRTASLWCLADRQRCGLIARNRRPEKTDRSKGWQQNKDRSGPISRVLSRATISLGRRLPGASSDLPGRIYGPDQPVTVARRSSCAVLLPVGFA